MWVWLCFTPALHAGQKSFWFEYFQIFSLTQESHQHHPWARGTCSNIPAPTSLLHSQTRAQHPGEGKMEHAPELHLLLQLTPQKPSHPGAVRVFTSTADPWPGEMPLLPHRNFMNRGNKPPLRRTGGDLRLKQPPEKQAVRELFVLETGRLQKKKKNCEKLCHCWNASEEKEKA